VLGEEYLAISSKAAAGLQAEVGPTEPITLPPGVTPPITPLCQCPEDYRANLDQRLSEIELGALLQPKFNADQILPSEALITPNQPKFMKNFAKKNILNVPVQ